eukprot:scaffold5731_cov119-Isochrysis_galbana.AAC.4
MACRWLRGWVQGRAARRSKGGGKGEVVRGKGERNGIPTGDSNKNHYHNPAFPTTASPLPAPPSPWARTNPAARRTPLIHGHNLAIYSRSSIAPRRRQQHPKWIRVHPE